MANEIEQIIEGIRKQGIIEAFGDGVSIQDRNFKILFQNQVHRQFVGEHVGDYCYTAYEKKEKKCEGCPLAETFEDGRVHRAERTAQTERGIEDFEITSSPIRDISGKIIGGIEIVRNITERKHLEKALKDSEKNLRHLVNSSLVGIYKTNLQGDILYVNGPLAAIFEYASPDELMSANVRSFYKNPNDRLEFITNLKNTGVVKSFETVALTRTGKTRNILLSAVLEKDIISGMLLDITGRKSSEDKVRKERDRAQMYLDVAGVMLLALDTKGNVRLINKRGCEILDYREDEIIGKNWFENFLPLNMRKEVSEVFQRLISGQADLAKYHENPVITRRGEERIIAWYNALLRDEEGSITGTLSSGEDVTLRKKIEQELKERIDELEQFYDTAIGRELKMKALKTEMEHLKAKLRGKPDE